MLNPKLNITDGTTTVNLLDLHGFTLQDWKPAVAEPKGGGTFRSSPLTDGRKLSYRKMDNVIDTFNLVGAKDSQNLMITSIQELERLLEKATSYWTSDFQNEPVWIEAKAANETNTRYAVIVDYRLTGFGGPYQQPFFGSDCNSATEVILLVEHKFWQETIPGEPGECVQISNQYYSGAVGTSISDTFYPNSSASDATFSRSDTGGDLTGHTIGVGFCSLLAGGCECGILFNNITVPLGAYIKKATLTLHAGVISIGEASIRVCAENIHYGPSLPFTTSTNFFSRVRDRVGVQVKLADGAYPGPIDVTNIITNITYNSSYVINWTAGDDLALFISSVAKGTGGREFISFDAGADYPELYIEWADHGTYLGRSETCDHEVVVSNKQNRSVITHVFHNRGAAWSANLIEEILPVGLLPTNPAVGDKLYIGSDTSYADGGVFNNVVFDLLSIQTGITTGEWTYPFGGGWEPFNVSGNSNSNFCGDEDLFSTLGVGSIVFNVTEGGWVNWVVDNVNGVDGYWICFEVLSVTGVPTCPVQQNRAIYTAINPYIDIAEDQVKGDIPALARIMFDAAGCYYQSGNTLIMGLRSLSRGTDFAAYLNCSDVQQPPGISFYYNSSVTLPSATYTPTGKYLHLHGIDTGDGSHWENGCYWTLSSDLAKQYIGTYHAYVRVYDSLAGAVTYRLRSVFGSELNVSYSDTGTTDANLSMQVIDLGQFKIHPSTSMRPNDNVETVSIYLDTISKDDSINYTWNEVYDIILIPADEWSGNFGVPMLTGSGALYYGNGLDVDGITSPRQYRAAQTIKSPSSPAYYTTYDDTYRYVDSEWARVTSGEPIFQANKDQRLWFTQYRQTGGRFFFFQNCGKVCAQRSSRYLLARGSR